MLFFIYRVDKPGSGALREATRPAHLDWAKTLGDRLIFAGPTLEDDGETMNGSLWVIEAADRAEAESLTAQDPYEKVNLFESKIVRPFMKVVPWDNDG